MVTVRYNIYILYRLFINYSCIKFFGVTFLIFIVTNHANKQVKVQIIATGSISVFIEYTVTKLLNPAFLNISKCLPLAITTFPSGVFFSRQLI